jgi:hypothetical protein
MCGCADMQMCGYGIFCITMGFKPIVMERENFDDSHSLLCHFLMQKACPAANSGLTLNYFFKLAFLYPI